MFKLKKLYDNMSCVKSTNFVNLVSEELLYNTIFSAIPTWREQVTFWWDDDYGVCFVLDQHAWDLIFYSSSLKQQCTVTLLRQIIMTQKSALTVKCSMLLFYLWLSSVVLNRRGSSSEGLNHILKLKKKGIKINTRNVSIIPLRTLIWTTWPSWVDNMDNRIKHHECLLGL
jgi:hypothetical protein